MIFLRFRKSERDREMMIACISTMLVCPTSPDFSKILSRLHANSREWSPREIMDTEFKPRGTGGG